MKMIDENIIDLKLIKNDENEIVMEVVIQQKNFIQLCQSYSFQNYLELRLAERIAEAFPTEKIHDVIRNIDMGAVTKLSTIHIAQRAADRT